MERCREKYPGADPGQEKPRLSHIGAVCPEKHDKIYPEYRSDIGEKRTTCSS
jgi:hypothetical protein